MGSLSSLCTITSRSLFYISLEYSGLIIGIDNIWNTLSSLTGKTIDGKNDNKDFAMFLFGEKGTSSHLNCLYPMDTLYILNAIHVASSHIMGCQCQNTVNVLFQL